MARFNSEIERMRHPQAKLIPKSMWRSPFLDNLDEAVLELMKIDADKVLDLLKEVLPNPEIKNNRVSVELPNGKKKVRKVVLTLIDDEYKRKKAWLGIALTKGQNFALLQEAATILGFTNHTLVELFATLGDVSLLQQYASSISGDLLQIGHHDYFTPYTTSAEHGHLPMLHYLEKHYFKSSRADLIAFKGFVAYQVAASNGHVALLQYFETQVPSSIVKMISEQNFRAFKLAAFRSELAVIKHLTTIVPNLFNHMIEADNFYSYRANIRQPHVRQWLLSTNSLCFAYAEANWQKVYGEVDILSFIKDYLHTLHTNALNISSNAVFDVKEPEQARICFYILRNLIRRNDRAFDDEIRFLLAVPAIKALVHTPVTRDKPNELLTLALVTDNRQAALLLLSIPAVKSLYREELNLAKLSTHRESSMVALTLRETKRLNAAIAFYEPTIQQLGVSNLMNELRVHLKERYTANPAFFINEQGKKVLLPMDFTEFLSMQLSAKEHDSALQAYYKNTAHTAWRYILKPNPWMHPEAEHIQQDSTTQAAWSTFATYQSLLVMFWLAAKDKAIQPTDGHTIASRTEQFINELSLIGRAHNWVALEGKNEESDDLEGDRPSCDHGAKRRLLQSVPGHSLLMVLTEDTLLAELRQFAQTYFQSCISEDKKDQYKAAFDDYIANTNDLDPKHKELLLTLNIPQEQQQNFEQYLIKKYGAQYTEDILFVQLIQDTLALSPKDNDLLSTCHALSLDGHVGLYQMLASKPNIAGESHSSTGSTPCFFKEPFNSNKMTEPTTPNNSVNPH